MTEKTLPTIDVQTEIYMVEGTEIKKEDVPESAEYEIHKLNKDGELQYVEACAQGATQRLATICRDGKYQAAADAVLAHAVSSGATISEYLGSIEIGIVVPPEHFEMAVELEEGEQYEVKAVLNAVPEDEMNPESPMKATMLGFIVEIFVTEPVLMRTRKIQYTEERELYSIDYVLFAVDSENQVSEQFTFSEYSEQARAEIDEHSKDDEDDIEQNTIFPICEQSYLDEVSEYLGVDYVAHGDFENNPIAQDEIQNHDDFKQQWFNTEQKPTIMQLIFERGIGHSEIMDVPQEKHMHTLHAYLRLMHKHRQRFTTNQVNATHYIVLLEPISTESTKAVPLEEGQYKRHQSICTREGVTVVCECVVFTADHLPVRKLSFGQPNETSLMYEEIFKFDENGQAQESEMIQHM